jgi:hypothetical protein
LQNKILTQNLSLKQQIKTEDNVPVGGKLKEKNMKKNNFFLHP